MTTNMTQAFDPSSAAAGDSGIFGLQFSETDSRVVYLPVPWEATTSYGGGTSQGPAAILAASRQVDLFDHHVLKPYEAGLYMRPEDPRIVEWNARAKPLARRVIEAGGDVAENSSLQAALEEVNAFGRCVNEWVQAETAGILAAGKLPGIVGGDHSVPFGAFAAAAAAYPKGFSILHFDAHSDTRKAYEGFEWSHASIMRCTLDRLPAVKRIVQVGIRDYCEEELEYCRSQGDRVRIFFDADLATRSLEGEAWSSFCDEIATRLTEDVWISFDIDGLDPKLCPNTGTPVPGGLSFHQANLILERVVRAGRHVIGFDLNEVSPGPNGDPWDANVGARLLYKLTGWALASRGWARVR